MTTLGTRAKTRTQEDAVANARALAAEAVGTGMLVAVIVGSGIMGAALSPENVGVALLINALATGMILVVLITILAPVSGAHYNPAVTFAFWLRREIATPAALGYGAVQVAAGIAGAAVAHAMFGLDLLQVGTHERWGAGQWLGEALSTFALVFTILAALAVRPQFVPAGVGLVVTAGIWATSSTCFANPAVTVARAFTDTFTSIRPMDAAVFVTIEMIAAGVIALFAGWLYAGLARPPN